VKAPIAVDDSWMAEGVCVDHANPDMWHERGREAEAVAVCQGCPVRQQCLSYALEQRLDYGVWGGHAAAERLRVIGRTQPRLHVFGVRVPRAAAKPRKPRVRLTAAQVEQARRDAAAGVSTAKLAIWLDVSPGVILDVLSGRTWPDAGGPVLTWDRDARQWKAVAQ
jgi:WhiB family transcriptional regulator, redox-sensing transcriptional regulator